MSGVRRMKINEVEQLVGITKRNIRFYEKEGLLAPGRNLDNGYREYGEKEVETLKQIKLLRKLDVPMEEIRRMQQGGLTLTDGLRRHLIHLERQQHNLATTHALCQELVEAGEQLSSLDAGLYLDRMARMEQEGVSFVNIKKRDTAKRYIGPVIACTLIVVLMGAIIALMLWAVFTEPQQSPPLPLVVILAAIPGAVILGAVAALWQRIKQIKGGEEDAASQY